MYPKGWKNIYEKIVCTGDGMTLENIQEKLKNKLSKERFVHSLNVMNSSVELAKKYGEDRDKAAVAGLLHDCAKNIEKREVFKICDMFGITVDEVSKIQPELLHGYIGSKLAERDYEVTDKSVLKAIYYHTTGCENMDLLDKIIFIADYIEPGRDFPGVDHIRETVFEDLDAAVILALDSTLRHVLSKGVLIHPLTVIARNSIIAGRLKSNQQAVYHKEVMGEIV